MRRFVIKVGTNLLTQVDNLLAVDFLRGLVCEFKDLLGCQIELILVTSGAVAAGRGELGAERGAGAESLVDKQVLAAVGQSSLMQQYYREFTLAHQVKVAQVLLSVYDFENPTSIKNTQNTLECLLGKRILPIVNENDVTATEELECMANDRLAARVAKLLKADGLILLTDVEGIFDCDPDGHAPAKFLPALRRESLPSICGSARPGGHGGVTTKLEAARMVECPVWVVNGRKKKVLAKIILAGENPGTIIQ